MERIDIINCVGREFLTPNIENGEFSYKQVLDDEVTGHFKLDLRFYDSKNKVAVLIETKKKFVKKDKEQLFAYAALEKNYVAPFAHRNAEDFPAVYGRR